MTHGKESRLYGTLILLSGLPGAGKTTFARRLQDRLAALHVESDAIRREFFPQPAYERKEHAHVFRTAEQRAAEGLRRGHVVIVDATNLTAKDRRRFVRLAARTGVRLVAVRLVAPDRTIRERLAEPREGWSQADARVYELMRGRAQPFAVPVVVVDTRFDLGPSVALVAQLATGEQGRPVAAVRSKGP